MTVLQAMRTARAAIGCACAIVTACLATPGNADEANIPCLIEPHRLVKLATPVAGVLSDVLVDRGSTVATGMLLARLESGVEEAELAAARVRAADESPIQSKDARRAFAEAKQQRLENLRNSSQFVSPTALEEALSDARQAKAESASARVSLRLNQIDADRAVARLGQRTLVSPLNGIVTERNLSPGEYAYDQAHVLTIAELDPLNIELFLPTSKYGSITMGQTLEILPEAPINGSYHAEVAVIDKVLDARSGTFGVRLFMPNPQAKVPAGIRCTARFIPDETAKTSTATAK